MYRVGALLHGELMSYDVADSEGNQVTMGVERYALATSIASAHAEDHKLPTTVYDSDGTEVTFYPRGTTWTVVHAPGGGVVQSRHRSRETAVRMAEKRNARCNANVYQVRIVLPR